MLAIHAYKQLVNIENWPQSVIMLLRILIVKYIFSELFLLTNHLSSAKTFFCLYSLIFICNIPLFLTVVLSLIRLSYI